MDDTAHSDGVTRLLAYYHARLLEAPRLCALLASSGLATPTMIAEHRLGFVDRTAQRAIRPAAPRLAAEMRAAWIAAGLLLPNGLERFRGCLIVVRQFGARQGGRIGADVPAE